LNVFPEGQCSGDCVSNGHIGSVGGYSSLVAVVVEIAEVVGVVEAAAATWWGSDGRTRLL
jgi:hypothetical protein